MNSFWRFDEISSFKVEKRPNSNGKIVIEASSKRNLESKAFHEKHFMKSIKIVYGQSIPKTLSPR